jgi:hypothetical protein
MRVCYCDSNDVKWWETTDCAGWVHESRDEVSMSFLGDDPSELRQFLENWWNSNKKIDV